MMIRTEQAQDYKGVYQLQYEAFGNRNDEASIVERIRISTSFVPELSLVAEQKGEIVGHIILSKATIVNELTEQEALVLGPIAVQPALQKQGIGGMLIREAVKRCVDLRYGLILLIGHPEYYPKFGFKQARRYGLDLKQYNVPDEVFMVYESISGTLEKTEGELRYPELWFTRE